MRTLISVLKHRVVPVIASLGIITAFVSILSTSETEFSPAAIIFATVGVVSIVIVMLGKVFQKAPAGSR